MGGQIPRAPCRVAEQEFGSHRRLFDRKLDGGRHGASEGAQGPAGGVSLAAFLNEHHGIFHGKSRRPKTIPVAIEILPAVIRSIGSGQQPTRTSSFWRSTVFISARSTFRNVRIGSYVTCGDVTTNARRTVVRRWGGGLVIRNGTC